MDYWQRIGLAGPREPTFATLAAVAAHHVRAIPFENLDVLLGHTPRLDLDSLDHVLDPGFGGLAPHAPVPLDGTPVGHFTATWPQSAFVQRMMLRAFTPDGRISAMNRELQRRQSEDLVRGV